jgi:copper oxidase (laccase) domain-containing protein
MKILGSQPKDILVSVGPHIGGCCYSIDKERKNKFIKKFGNLPGMISKKRDKAFLNLAIPVKIQLIESGIKNKNIELSRACTSCQIEEFFSYRRDSQETYGEILGVISLID